MWKHTNKAKVKEKYAFRPERALPGRAKVGWDEQNKPSAAAQDGANVCHCSFGEDSHSPTNMGARALTGEVHRTSGGAIAAICAQEEKVLQAHDQIYSAPSAVKSDIFKPIYCHGRYYHGIIFNI